MVQDADGTRVTTWADGAWRVEAPGMPPVLGDTAGIECQAAPGQVAPKCSHTEQAACFMNAQACQDCNQAKRLTNQ